MADYERAETVEAPGEAVRVRVEIDGREQEGEAWFRVDRDARRVEWGSEGPNERTLGNVKRLVEEPGGADA